MQIISMLIFLSRVTDAWNWSWWECLGATKYRLTFYNRMAVEVPGYDMGKMEMTIQCTYSSNDLSNVKLKLNPKASFTFCGEWIGFTGCTCTVRLSNSNWVRVFNAFIDISFSCEKKRHCQWKISKTSPFLYDPYKNKYVRRRYFWFPYYQEW